MNKRGAVMVQVGVSFVGEGQSHRISWRTLCSSSYSFFPHIHPIMWMIPTSVVSWVAPHGENDLSNHVSPARDAPGGPLSVACLNVSV